MTYLRMADAAQAVNIPPGFQIIAGYYGGPGAYRIWTDHEWAMFPGYRLPIWVAAEGNKNGTVDGEAAISRLKALGVPPGSFTALDMETMHDASYVHSFGATMAPFYRTWVYGSVSTVFDNPPLNGYWVADYTTNTQVVDALLQTGHVRACQFAADVPPGYDISLVKQWTEGGMWHG